MDKFPIRINKYLALKNYSTRRGADELISLGKVTINGRKANLGDKVEEGDSVEVKGLKDKKYVYYAYYKPAGIVTTGNKSEGERIEDVTNFTEKVFPVGRLDKESEGLIILTNDGRITEKLLSPEAGHEKEYLVTVDRPITHEFLVKMSNKVDIGIHKTKKSKVRRIDKDTFEIILSEGKNRQIRRMCGVLGFGVKKLKRFRIMDIMIGKLRPNKYRELTAAEIKRLFQQLKLPVS